jgi:glucose-1-phosphate thymidylyltransferase
LTTAVILARGLGTRMRRDEGAALDPAQAEAADAGLKAMIPVGRPFLDYVLSALADAGFTRVCLVIGPEHGAVRDYYGRDHRPERLEVVFAIQPEPRGTADAVLAAKPMIAGAEFAVLNADNYYPVAALRMLRGLDGPGTVLFDADALVQHSNIPAERIRDFAYAGVDAEGVLVDLIEKPREGDRDLSHTRLVSMNIWRFDDAIFPVCRDVPRSPRGEHELPLAVRLAVERGMRLRTATCREGVLDLSRRTDIAAVAERLRDVQVRL